MLRSLGVATRVAFATLLLCGLVYPLAVTGLAQALFPDAADGSLVRDARGRLVGSTLVAQAFTQPRWFQPRPSAAGPRGYDAMRSGGSNLGPTSKALRTRGVDAAARLRRENPEAAGPIPVELVTTSASGLDPHLSPEAALWQVPRVARARGLPEARLRALVRRHIEPRDLGVFGEPRVNVLRLNLALARELEP